ncbi:MAG: hypothetical protein P1V97_26355 [Planctomycetota bacterium]|nr:hypothetical protein [Planctomycetota bacterium]
MQRLAQLSILILSLCSSCSSPQKDKLKTKEPANTKISKKESIKAVNKSKATPKMPILPLPPRGFDMPDLTTSFDLKLKKGQIFLIKTIKPKTSVTKTAIEILKATDGFPRAVKISSILSRELSGTNEESTLSGKISTGKDGLAVFSDVKGLGPLYSRRSKATLEKALLRQSRGFMVPGHYYPLEDRDYKIGDQWAQGEVHPEKKWQRSTRSTLVALLNVEQKKIAKIHSLTVVKYQSGDLREENSVVYWNVSDGFAVYQKIVPEETQAQPMRISTTKMIRD